MVQSRVLVPNFSSVWFWNRSWNLFSPGFNSSSFGFDCSYWDPTSHSTSCIRGYGDTTIVRPCSLLLIPSPTSLVFSCFPSCHSSCLITTRRKSQWGDGHLRQRHEVE